MKKLIALALALVMVLSLGCVAFAAEDAEAEEAEAAEDAEAAEEEPIIVHEGPEAADEGKVLNIYAWNEEFKGFFDKYYKVPDGVTVNWIITPSDNGAYQQKLDEALLGQESAADDEKVDLFLAEADYILKYTDSDYTQDITAMGVDNFDNAYTYTVQAASDADGVVKGVSFQCCPAAMIYRRSIAKDVLGTDDPAEVQEAVSDWDKFEAVAAQAKDKGYYMTASFASTYRVFSNNVTSPWVDADNNLQFDPQIESWIAQTESFVQNGYTLPTCPGIWDDEANAQMFADGKTMCWFGPAWYFNFNMGNAQDSENGCFGDWAICQGPQAHFWGGTWLLAPAGTDNPTLVADIMNAFINDEDVCAQLIKNEAQFTNNKAVNEAIAEDPDYKNDFLGGQNDVAMFVGMADNIKFENQTIYDQLLNEGLQNNLQDYFKSLGGGEGVDKDTALQNFYNYVNETYPSVITPAA